MSRNEEALGEERVSGTQSEVAHDFVKSLLISPFDFKKTKGLMTQLQLILRRVKRYRALTVDDFTVPDWANQKGYPILHSILNAGTGAEAIAFHQASELILSLLELGANINEGNEYGHTLLHYAATRNQREWIDFLLDRGADISAKDNNEQCAIFSAVSEGHLEITQILADRLPHLKMLDKEGLNLLTHAVTGGHLSVMDELIQRDSKLIGLKDPRYGRSLLHSAVRDIEGSVKASSVILQLMQYAEFRNIDINLKDYYGKTALHHASEKGFLETAQTLIQCGANPRLTDKHHRTPLDTATFYNHQELKVYLESIRLALNEASEIESLIAPLIKNEENQASKDLSEGQGSINATEPQENTKIKSRSRKTL